MQKNGLAVIFPGIGYNFDRPLLHFAKEQAVQFGYEVIPVGYSGFPRKIMGDQARMQESLDLAWRQTEEILKDVKWEAYAHIIFFSKSIGTIVATRFATVHQLSADQVLFTPFPQTFESWTSQKRDDTNREDGTTPMSASARPRAIAFHAQTDPWMDDQEVIAAARKAGVPMQLYPKGNHSLETGDTLEDIRILEEVFTKTQELFY